MHLPSGPFLCASVRACISRAVPKKKPPRQPLRGRRVSLSRRISAWPKAPAHPVALREPGRVRGGAAASPRASRCRRCREGGPARPAQRH